MKFCRGVKVAAIAIAVSSVNTQQIQAEQFGTEPIPPYWYSTGFGSTEVYRGQTFRIPSDDSVLANRITVFFSQQLHHGARFRLLITEVDTTAGFHPTNVLFESATVEVPFSWVPKSFDVNLSGLLLQPEHDYAWILDYFSVGTPGSHVSMSVGLGSDPSGMGQGNYPDGFGFGYHSGPFFPGGTRADHFASSDWFLPSNKDYAFQITYEPYILNPDTHYVDLNNPAPSPPYTNWVTAANNIQAAIDAAADGDMVLIADGTYNITSKINVMKSVTIASVNGAEHVTVDADGNCRIFTLSSDSGVITLDGLTLSRGYANHAVKLGGAIFAYGNSDICIANCIIENNRSPGSAGGININANAGKHVTATVTNCLIRSNQAAEKGGGIGINIGGSCDISITDCTVEGNSAKNGGGIFCNAPNGWIDVLRCMIVSNTAVQTAGGIRCQRNTLLSDSLITGNQAGQKGGGEHGGMTDIDSYIVNCTIVDNEAPVGGGVSRATLFNSIVYGNRAATYPDITPDSVVAISCSPDVTNGENGNLTADPQFIDPANSDYRLLATSPCIDAGTNAFVLSDLDLGWSPRVADGDFDGRAVVDMGAYEFTVLPIAIDIKPGSGSNPINLKSKGRIPVAILTTGEFDAMEVKPSTVRFAGAAPVHAAHEDADGDSYADLLLHFTVPELQLTEVTEKARIIAQTHDGTVLMGEDIVTVVP